MTTIYLIRHADAEEKDRTKGADLTEKGVLQAQKLAERFRTKDVHVFYCSSYLRSRHTAKIIAAPHRKKVLEAKDQLIEVDFRVKKRLSLASFKELENFYTKTEVEQIENLLTAQKRALRLLEHLFNNHPDQTILIVTHGNIIKAIVLGIFQLKLARFQKFDLKQASISKVVGTNLDDAKIMGLNDTAHLEN